MQPTVKKKREEREIPGGKSSLSMPSVPPRVVGEDGGYGSLDGAMPRSEKKLRALLRKKHASVLDANEKIREVERERERESDRALKLAEELEKMKKQLEAVISHNMVDGATRANRNVSRNSNDKDREDTRNSNVSMRSISHSPPHSLSSNARLSDDEVVVSPDRRSADVDAGRTTTSPTFSPRRIDLFDDEKEQGHFRDAVDEEEGGEEDVAIPSSTRKAMKTPNENNEESARTLGVSGEMKESLGSASIDRNREKDGELEESVDETTTTIAASSSSSSLQPLETTTGNGALFQLFVCQRLRDPTSSSNFYADYARAVATLAHRGVTNVTSWGEALGTSAAIYRNLTRPTSVDDDTTVEVTSRSLFPSIQDDSWTAPLGVSLYMSQVVEITDDVVLFSAVRKAFEAPRDLPDVLKIAAKEGRAVARTVDVPLPVLESRSVCQGIEIWQPLPNRRAMIRIVYIWPPRLAASDDPSPPPRPCVRIVESVASELESILSPHPAAFDFERGVVEVDPPSDVFETVVGREEDASATMRRERDELKSTPVAYRSNVENTREEDRARAAEMSALASMNSESREIDATAKEETNDVDGRARVEIRERREKNDRGGETPKKTTITTGSQDTEGGDSASASELRALRHKLAMLSDRMDDIQQKSIETDSEAYERREPLSPPIVAENSASSRTASDTKATRDAEERLESAQKEFANMESLVAELREDARQLSSSNVDLRRELDAERSVRNATEAKGDRMLALVRRSEDEERALRREIHRLVETSDETRREARERERLRLKKFEKKIRTLQIRCEDLQNRASIETESASNVAVRQRLIANALAALEKEKNTWASRLKAAALEFGVQSTEERAMFQEERARLQSEVAALTNDLCESRQEHADARSRASDEIRVIRDSTRLDESSVRRSAKASVSKATAFFRWRDAAQKDTIEGLRQSLRAALEAQLSMERRCNAEREESRERWLRTSQTLRRSESRTEAARREVANEISAQYQEKLTSETAEVRRLQHLCTSLIAEVDEERFRNSQAMNTRFLQASVTSGADTEWGRNGRVLVGHPPPKADDERQRDDSAALVAKLRKRCRVLEAEAETEQEVAARARKESVRIASAARRDMILADEAVVEADRRFRETERLLENLRKKGDRSPLLDASGEKEYSSPTTRVGSTSTKRALWHTSHHTNGPFY